MNFSPIESSVLKRAQEDIPLVPEPFVSMARDAGITEDEFITVIARMKESGVIRNIAGIFSAQALGYRSALVAFMVAGPDVEHAASVINGHPGVSHNYLRDHEYNVWFTLAAETEEQLEKTVNVLEKLCKAKDGIILNNEKMYKLGVKFSMDDEDTGPAPQAVTAHAAAISISGNEREAVRLLQVDMPLIRAPFAEILREKGSALSEQAFLELALELRKKGALRRYAAVLRHRKAGYTANAMTVWRPAGPEQLEAAADIFRQEKAVSHLYARTVYPGRWEYPLFAMIHTRSDAELEGIIGRFAEHTGIGDYRVLRSLKEFKKERVAYFSEKFSEWNTREKI